jgi:hypothetical protein
MKTHVCGCDLDLYWRHCNFVRPKTQLVVENNDRARSILNEAWSEVRETDDSPNVTGEHDLV